jgi:dihydrofolate reductase
MSKITLMMNTTIDAKVARPDGDLEWFLTDERHEDVLLALMRQVDAMLFGRVSYELLAQYWPTAGAATADEAPGGFTSAERANEFARLMNTIPKIVVSHRPHELPWGPATSIHGDVVGALRKMKDKDGGHLVLFAGADLATTLIDADLVDEYRLMVHPIVLGKGLPLFDRIGAERTLELLDVVAFPSGVVQLRYKPAPVPAT